ncbi:G-protein coupled receptor 4-like [Xyrauchen texanus]|uniref:G-protein coupled receptor 4-like n=1 Tax=Xyrauchen texanus TaxID=154827 RepID=UPI00224202B7|nr:G-protein coupled receptor 4-like [Xyrauchen texanus]
MNNSIVKYNMGEASKNSSTQSFGLLDSLQVCLYILNFLVGLPTHSYVIWLIVTGTGSGIASGFFNLNLSVSEMGNCLNCLFCVLDYLTPLKSLKAFLFGLGITGRPLFQCLMCVERYLAVVHPVTFLKFKPLRYRVICSTVAWIITFGSCLCCLFILGFLLFDSYIYVWFFLLQFIIFLSIQLFCLSAVLRALKQSGPGERGREREEENSIKRRAFYLILITTVNMGLIYVPLTISGFYIIMSQQNIDESYFIGFMFFVLAGFVQPVLYLHRNGKLSFLCRSKMCNCVIMQS